MRLIKILSLKTSKKYKQEHISYKLVTSSLDLTMHDTISSNIIGRAILEYIAWTNQTNVTSNLIDPFVL